MADELFTTTTFTYEAKNNYIDVERGMLDLRDDINALIKEVEEERKKLIGKSETHALVANAIASGKVVNIGVTIYPEGEDSFTVRTALPEMIDPILKAFEESFRLEVLSRMQRLETAREQLASFTKKTSKDFGALPDKLTA